jgi:hypothetical protein
MEEDGDDAGVDEVSKHSTDDWDDEEWLDCIAVFIAYSTHVGHSKNSEPSPISTQRSFRCALLLSVEYNKMYLRTIYHYGDNYFEDLWATVDRGTLILRSDRIYQ